MAALMHCKGLSNIKCQGYVLFSAPSIRSLPRDIFARVHRHDHTTTYNQTVGIGKRICNKVRNVWKAPCAFHVQMRGWQSKPWWELCSNNLKHGKANTCAELNEQLAAWQYKIWKVACNSKWGVKKTLLEAL